MKYDSLLLLLWLAACANPPVEKPATPTIPPQAVYELGLSHLEAREYHQARVFLEQAADLSPGQATYRNALGLANLHLGRTPQAIAAFREALKLNPNFPDAYNNLGVALAQDGKWEESVGVLEKVLTFPTYNSPEIAYQNLGWAYYNLGRYSQAEEVLRRALRMDPTLTIATYTLGLVLEKQGRPQDALATYREALKLAPEAETGRKAQERIRALEGAESARPR